MKGREPDDYPELVGDLMATMRQGLAMIEDLSDAAFCTTFDALGLSSVGAHYRHHLEHVRLLLEGLSCGEVDYDRRERGGRVECCVEAAAAATADLLEALAGLREADLARAVTVTHRVDSARPGRPEEASTVARELMFLVSHAIHHYALIAIVVRLMGGETAKDFGVMPSTVTYHQRAAGE